VARESSELIITDDNIASLVAGVEQGRIAYANVRKVIFLLISTGAVEVAIFLLSLAAGMPLPLTAIQLLWLNVVTEGIQHVGLAFEPAEGDEMARRPRPPRERIFNRVMIERVLLSAAVMGSLAFAVFWYLYTVQQVSLEQARNATLLAMVLFENFQVFNSRSETLSVFRHNPLRNRLLLFGTLGAQLVHIAAMHVPGVNTVLQIQPVSFELWFEMLLVAAVIVVAMELHKLLQRHRLAVRP
jgi:magnesium-transporting ATPase (P-type)